MFWRLGRRILSESWTPGKTCSTRLALFARRPGDLPPSNPYCSTPVSTDLHLYLFTPTCLLPRTWHLTPEPTSHTVLQGWSFLHFSFHFCQDALGSAIRAGILEHTQYLMDVSPVYYQSRSRCHSSPALIILTIPSDIKICCTSWPWTLLLPGLITQLCLLESFLPSSPSQGCLNLPLSLPTALDRLVSLSSSPMKPSSQKAGACDIHLGIPST